VGQGRFADVGGTNVHHFIANHHSEYHARRDSTVVVILLMENFSDFNWYL
jgi:hypothetical protein